MCFECTDVCFKCSIIDVFFDSTDSTDVWVINICGFFFLISAVDRQPPRRFGQDDLYGAK